MKSAKHLDMISLSDIQAIVFDCDGVLTPGDLFYDEHGRRLLRFYSKDGAGMALAARVGIKLGILSGRPVDIAEQRFAELGVTAFKGKCRDKKLGLIEICQVLQVTPEQTAFVADDVPDLAAFSIAGCKVAVADSCQEILQSADLVLQAKGGYGAAREICEMILKAQGKWPYQVVA